MKNYSLLALVLTLGSFCFGSSLEVTIFDVGQGNGILFSATTKDEESIPPLLCDCGSSAYSFRGKDHKKNQIEIIVQKIAQSLELVEEKIFNILVSHPDSDHYGWIQEVVDKCKAKDIFVGTIILGGLEKFYSSSFKGLLATLKTGPKASKIIYLTEKGATTEKYPILSSKNVSFEILPALACSSKKDSNAASLVLLATCGKLTCMVMGDATKKTAEHLQRYLRSCRANLLIASHHGAQEDGCNDEKWTKKVAPDMVVMSSGIHGYGHPCSSIVTRFSENLDDDPSMCQPVIFGGGGGDEDEKRPHIRFSNDYVFGMTSKPLFGTLSHGTMAFSWSGNDTEIGLPKCSIKNKITDVKSGMLSTLSTPRKIRTFGFEPEIIVVVNLSNLGINDEVAKDRNLLCKVLTLLKDEATFLRKLYLSSNKIGSKKCYDLILTVLENKNIRDFDMANTGISGEMKGKITMVWANRGLSL